MDSATSTISTMVKTAADTIAGLTMPTFSTAPMARDCGPMIDTSLAFNAYRPVAPPGCLPGLSAVEKLHVRDAMTLAHIQRGRGFMISLGETSPMHIAASPRILLPAGWARTRVWLGHSPRP